MRPEDIEAAIVHVGQKLGRTFGEIALDSLDLHPPGFTSSRPQVVTKGGELELELLVVPGHEDRVLHRHQLMVAYRRQSETEATAIGLGNRKLENLEALIGSQHLAAYAPAFPECLKHHPLPRKTGVHEQASGAADRHRRSLRHQEYRQRQPGGSGRDHHEFRGGRKLRSKCVTSCIAQTICAGFEWFELEFGQTVFQVTQPALADALLVFPVPEDLRHRHLSLPARSESIARGAKGGRRRTLLGGRLRQLQIRRQGRFCGLPETGKVPGSRPRARAAVQVLSLEPEHRPRTRDEEVALALDPRLHRDKAETEDPLRRAGFAPTVGNFDGNPKSVANTLPSLALVGLGEKIESESAGVIELGGARGDRLYIRGSGRVVPPPPVGVYGLAGDPPGDLSVDDRQPEVVACLARNRGGAIQSQGLVGGLEEGLEGRPLVLFDAQRRAAAERRAQTPSAEQAPRGNIEAT